MKNNASPVFFFSHIRNDYSSMLFILDLSLSAGEQCDLKVLRLGFSKFDLVTIV